MKVDNLKLIQMIPLGIFWPPSPIPVEHFYPASV